MRPARAPNGLAGEVPADARLAAIAARVMAAERPLAVVEDGRVVGVIGRDEVVAALIGRLPVDA
jgi:CBS domain-containing protein